MLSIKPLVTVLIASFVLGAPKSGNQYGTGGGPPAGYSTVENFCTAPEALIYCNGESIAGVAGQATSSQTGCTENAMAGGQINYEFGYCPVDFKPFCCAAAIAAGIESGCGLPTQVYEPSN